MLKSVIKEIIILLLLSIAILLILMVLFYDYIPKSEEIPIIQAYTTPEDVKNELNTDISESEKIEVTYEVTGECKKCGKCCNYMYSYDTYTEKEFKIMQFLFPTYRRFYIKGKESRRCPCGYQLRLFLISSLYSVMSHSYLQHRK